MDRYKKLVSNTFVLAIGQLGSKLLVYIMMRFYTDVLGTGGYGDTNNINYASTLIVALATLSIGEAVIRFGLDKKCNNTQVFSIAFTTVITGLIILIPFMPLINLLDNININLSEYTLLIYLWVVSSSFKSICSLFVRSIGNVRLFAIDGIFTTFVNVVLNIIFLKFFDLGVTGYALSVILADVASIVFLFMLGGLKNYIQFIGLDKQLRKAMYRFSIPMIPTTMMWWITSVSDSFIVTAMLGSDANGVYNSAYKLPSIIAIISGTFSQAWNMSAITEKNSRTIAKFYTDVFNFLQSIIYVVTAGLLLVVRPLLSFMAAGDGFTDAYLHSPMLALAVLFTCFSTFMGSIYIAAKKSKRSMITTSCGAIINIILNILLIPIMGIDGAALSTMISYIVIFVIRAVDTHKLVYMDLKLPKMITNLVILGLMAVVVMLVSNIYQYYLFLIILFLFIVVINYRAGISALNYVFKNRRQKAE